MSKGRKRPLISYYVDRKNGYYYILEEEDRMRQLRAKTVCST